MTSTEQAIAEYLASGNQITRLPPCCLALADAKPRDVVELTIKLASPTPATRRASERENDHRKKLEASAEKARRTAEAKAHLDAIRANKKAERLARVLRLIGGEWTRERLMETARVVGCSYKTLRTYLRENSLGDKLPAQARHKKALKEKAPRKTRARTYTPRPKRDTTHRDAGICADYRAGALVKDIASKWRVGARTVRELVSAAGIQLREQTKGRMSPDRLAERAARDAQVRAAYEAMTPMADLCSKFGMDRRVVLNAIKRAGGKARSRGRPEGSKCPPREPSEEDRQITAFYQTGASILATSKAFGCNRDKVIRAIARCEVRMRAPWAREPSEHDKAVAAFYLAGNGMETTGKHFGRSKGFVERALRRCKVETRSESEARRLQAAQRGAA